ncbi:hypothetical protein BC826DRAFT_1108793 [Russula brevipes]|nr:hypothetical protein BC826DRAFT_1108793 [Russula brevipes]
MPPRMDLKSSPSPPLPHPTRTQPPQNRLFRPPRLLYIQLYVAIFITAVSPLTFSQNNLTRWRFWQQQEWCAYWIGGIAGGAGGLIVVIILGLLYWRRNRNRRRPVSGVNPDRDRAVQIQSHTGIAGAEVTESQYDPGVGGTISGGSTMATAACGNIAITRHSSVTTHLKEEGDSARLSSSKAGSSSPSRTGLEPSVSRVKAHRRKEHESLRKRGDLGLASAPEEGEVIRHMEGGHGSGDAPPSSTQEIPPSYEPIPAQ